MSGKSRGWTLAPNGSRHVRIALGQRGQRVSCSLVTCGSDAEADERAALVREVGALLVAAGHAAEVAKWGKVACEADDAKALAVLAYAKQVAAGKVTVARADGPTAGKTFADVARAWTSGELARRYPDQVVVKRTADADVSRLRVLSKVVGSVPIVRFTVDDAERAMRSLPPGLRPASRRHFAQAMRRVLELAAYPLRLIPSNPLPRLFLPRVRADLALQVLFPDEEAKLMACAEVPIADRLAYGFLARMGFRKSEIVGDKDTDAEPLRWADFDLERGFVMLARSKTDKPRPVPLAADVTAALAAWKVRVGPAADDAPVFGLNVKAAETFREHLLAAGVDRAELHTRTKDSLPIRVHDLRATFVTVSMATGKPDAWIRDRTGHRTVSMLDRYRRAARTFGELRAGELVPLVEAIPELNAGAGTGANAAPTERAKEADTAAHKSQQNQPSSPYRGRTGMPFRAKDFKSSAYAIPPRGQLPSYFAASGFAAKS